MRAALVLVPLLLGCLQLGKQPFDLIEVCRVGRQIQQLNACFEAHLFDALGVVEGCVVHGEDGVRAAVVE